MGAVSAQRGCIFFAARSLQLRLPGAVDAGHIMRRWWALALRGLVVLAAAVLLAPGRADAASTTSTLSTTTSGTTTVVVPGNSPLANALSAALAGPNGSLVANALTQAFGPGAASQTVNTFVTTTEFVGPQTIPIGNGPGTFANGVRVGPINCNGPPTTWPAPNCNLAGYQQFVIPAGGIDFNTNVDYDIATNVTLAGGGAGMIAGDLYTTIQTTILDNEFIFIDSLFARARSAASSSMPTPYAVMRFADDGTRLDGDDGPAAMLGYAPRSLSATPPFVKAPPPDTGIWSIWAKGEGAIANFSGTATNFGFGYRSAGSAFGVDYLKHDWLAGIAVAYDNAMVTQDVSGDNGSIGSLRLGGYASYQPGPWSFTGVLGGGFHSVSADRLMVLPTPATASYDANTIDAGFEAARRYAFGSGTIQPMAGLVYTGLHTDAFTESGGSSLGITSSSADIDSLKGYVGARAWTTYEVMPGFMVMPELRARLLYDFLNDPRAFTAAFLSDPTMTPFTVTGITPDRTAALLGASLGARLDQRWIAFVNYDAEIRGSSLANFISGGLKASW